MPTSKKPRKKYRPPSHIYLNPVAIALEKTQSIAEYDPEYVRTLSLKTHSAMDNMARGQANKWDMNQLIALHNYMEGLRRLGIVEPLSNEIAAVRRALIDISIRAIKVNKFVATGPELQALKTLVVHQDEVLPGLTPKDFDDALAMAKEIIAKKDALVLPTVEEINDAHGTKEAKHIESAD